MGNLRHTAKADAAKADAANVEAAGEAADVPLARVWLRALAGGGWRDLGLLLRVLLGLIAAFAVAQVLRTVLGRIGHPFELEWMEGAVVDHIRVVLSGQPLYREPSIEFTPFIYTPFYYYVCSVFCRALGVGFLVPRVVSATAMLGSMALIGDLVRRETASRLAALVAVGLFAATYECSGFWMDLARVDSLFTMFVLLGVYLARYGRSRMSAVACGVVLFLGFFTKQTGLTLAGPILVVSIVLDRRRGALAAVAFAVLVAGSVVWMNRSTNGWFGYYVFDVPSQHALRWDQWRTLLVEPFWRPVVVPVLLCLVAFFSGTAARHGRFVGWFYAGILGATLLTSYSSMMHSDGFANVLIPYYAAVSIVAGVGLAWVLRVRDESPPQGTTSIGWPRVQAFVMVALSAHFGALSYNHHRALPKARDRDAGRNMLSKLRKQPGPVLMFGTGYYASLAGHDELNANTMALTDVFKTRDEVRKQALLRSVIATIRSKRFRAVVLDPSSSFLPAEIIAEVHRSYRLAGRMFEPSEQHAAWPKTGFASRPEELWVVEDSAHP